MQGILYFDNASTSYPKPEEVRKVLSSFYDNVIGSYGRSLDRNTLDCATKVELLRDNLARFIGTTLAEHIVFCHNATMGSNTILNGLDFIPNDKVLCTHLEHNAVARPLQRLKEKKKVIVEYFPSRSDGSIATEELDQIRWDNYRLIVICVESNVNGVVQPLDEVARYAKEYNVPILLDATQYIDVYHHLEVDKWGIDYVFITGHKGLLGPTGTGAFFVREPKKIDPLIIGGNGHHSQSLDVSQDMPSRYESGTLDMLSLNALYVATNCRPNINLSIPSLCDVMQEIVDMGYKVYRSLEENKQGYVFSITHTNIPVNKLYDRLYHDYGIITREGVHCTPMAHQWLGTLPYGTVRISPSPFYHTEQDMIYLLNALNQIANSEK